MEGKGKRWGGGWRSVEVGFVMEFVMEFCMMK